MDWGLPAPYALAAGFHEELDSVELGESTTRRVAELLHLSYRIALLCHGIKPSPEYLDMIENMAHGFDVVEGDFSSIFDTIVNRWQEWGQTFNIPTKQCLLYDEIKAGVSENSGEASGD